jgi:hypothetical protein
MAPSTTIHIHPSADPAAVALERLAWAERRRSAAAREVAQAKRRLIAAEEQVRQARGAVREARGRHATPGGTGEEMIGMGYFADEVAHGAAA